MRHRGVPREPDWAPGTPIGAAVAAALLLLFVVLAVQASREDSVTIDEFVHLPVGLYMLQTRDFAPDPINPPYTRMIAALPVLFSPVHFAPEASIGHWGMGYRFMQENVADYQALYVRSRCMIILITCVLGVLVFVWAFQIHGVAAGIAAVFLFALSPEILAHGHLVTLDMAGALGFTASAYAVWRFLERPSHARAAATGVILGLSVLLKLSGVTMIAVAAIAIAVSRFDTSKRQQEALGFWLALGAIAVAALLLTLNLGYGFQGTFAALERATLHDGGFLAAVRKALPWLRLPLPLPLLNGIDEVMTTGIANEPQYFLAGELSARGWWYYHLATFVLKTPLPLLIATAIAFASWLTRRYTGARSYCLFIPIIFIFVFNSLFNSQDIGVRHILPVYPLLFVVVSPLVAQPLVRLLSGGRSRSELIQAAVVVLGAAWFTIGTLAVAPRYLQFFNEMAGGAENGHRFLIDSNIDWGQDLIRLKRYIDEHATGPVNLAYFGRVDPRVYGIEFAPLVQGAHGTTVVSASLLMGRPYFWFTGDGEIRWMGAGTYSWLQQHQPIARVGALFVYDLP